MTPLEYCLREQQLCAARWRDTDDIGAWHQCLAWHLEEALIRAETGEGR